ncbi:MAG: hypothetical protein HYX61_10865 [Gammaproteobacteria bacterium]|jgi:hypothetical protein|nr:hypothetical protein [Gammaproteobacteria bacterium]
MFKSLLDLAKNVLVSTSILKPIYNNVQFPIYQRLCKPLIEMVKECSLWGLWCSLNPKDTGKTRCTEMQKIAEVCDISGYELSQEAIGALAIGTGALAISVGSYFWYTRKKQQETKKVEVKSEFPSQAVKIKSEI